MQLSELTQDDRDRYVLYTRGSGPKQRGRIKWWNDKYVFVVYHCDGNWDDFHNYTAAATSPDDLEFEQESGDTDG